MRVLFVTPYYKPAHLGGIERAIEKLAAALGRQQGITELGVLTTPYAFPPRYVHGLPPRETLPEGLRVYRLRPTLRTPLPLFPYYSCPVTLFRPAELRAVLAHFQPDVVHLVGDGWVWPHLWLLGQRAAATAVVFTPSFHDLRGSRAWLALPNRAVCRAAERTTVLTEHERRGVTAAYHPSPARLVTVPWGVDLPPRAEAGPVRPPQGAVTVLCVGRLGQHKGQAWLLDLYGRTRPAFQRLARLVFVGKDEGDSGGRAALVRRIAAAGLEDEVVLAGEVDDAALARYYASADLFALFSRYEAFGLVYCEAMAHGVPVLTHRVGANAEVLAQGAVLTAPYAAAEAAAALVALVNDAPERARLGAQARAFVENTYSWETVAARYRRVYEEAIDERRRPPRPAPRRGPAHPDR